MGNSYFDQFEDDNGPGPKKPAASYFDKFDKSKSYDGKMQNVAKATSTSLLGVNTGYGKSKYDKDLNWATSIDPTDVQGSLNEYRADQQGFTETVLAGAGRATTKAMAETLKTPGVVLGMATGLIGNTVDAMSGKDDTTFVETAFNNFWIKGIDAINKDIEDDLMPVYVHKAVQDGNLYNKMFSSEFWATDGADGLGYAIGMIVPGAAMGKLGLGAKLIDRANKLEKYAAIFAGADRAEKFVQAASKLGVTARNIDSAVAISYNTLAEAGAESKEFGDNFRAPENKAKVLATWDTPKFLAGEKFQQASSAYLKEIDDKRKNGEISIDEANALTSDPNAVKQAVFDRMFEDQASKGQLAVFGMNAAILLGPNALLHQRLFGRVGRTAEEVAEKGARKTGVKGALQYAGEKASKYGKVALENTASEGFWEEGMQSTVSKMYQHYAEKNQIDDLSMNFNIEDLVKEYADMIGSTEGQVAVMLGGVLGTGMSGISTHFQTKEENKIKNAILNRVDVSLNTFNTAFNAADIYERDENNNIVMQQDAEGNILNKPKINEQKAADLVKSLATNDLEQFLYTKAIEQGNTDFIRAKQEEALFQMVLPAIYNGEKGLQLLKQQMNANKDFQDIAARDNDPTSKVKFQDVIDKAIEVAEHLQKENDKFNDFSEAMIDLKDERLDRSKESKEWRKDYLNELNQRYLSSKYDIMNNEKRLKELEKQRDNVIQELNIQMTPAELLSNAALVNNTMSTNPLFKKTIEDINAVSHKIRKDKNDIAEVWDGKSVEGSFKDYVNKRIEAKEKAAETAALEATLDAINKATTLKDLENIQTEDEGIKLTINKKRALLKAEEEGRKTEKKKTSKKESNRKNIQATDEYDAMADIFEEGDKVILDEENKHLGLDKTKVEGKDFTVKSIDKQNGNILITDGTDEHVISFETLANIFDSNPEANFGTEGGLNPTKVQEPEKVTSTKDAIHTSVDSKLITVDPATNEAYPWIDPAAVEFERVPRDKKGEQIEFSLNESTGLSEEQTKAQEMVKNKDFSDIEFLAKHLPLDSIFSSGAKASVETYNEDYKDKFERTSLPMRRAIVLELAKGTPISAITTTVAGQNNGDLQIAPLENGTVAENSLLGLYEVSDDIKKITMDNLYIVDDLGNLINGKGQKWAASRRLAKGEVYLRIHTANGTPFPLKLNVKKINELQAEALYNLYKYRFEDIKERNKSTLLVNLPQEDQDVIKANLSQELALFDANGQKYDSLTLKDVIDFLIWDGSKNPKSQVRFYDGKLLVGSGEYSQEEFSTPEAKEDFIARITSPNDKTAKRHHIRFKDKKGGVKSLTVDNPNRLYLEYIINNGILNTNAAVGTPSFQGNTSIYLTPDNVRVNGTISEFNPEVKRDKFKSIIGSMDAISKKLPGLFKFRFNLEGQNYKDRYGNLYERVSTLKSKKDSKDNLGMRNSAKRGDIIDSAFRDFFLDTKFHNLEEFLKMFHDTVKRVNKERKENIPVEFSDDVAIKLFQTFNSYAELFQNNDWKVYAAGFKVGGRLGNLGAQNGRYAGTTDFVVEDSKSGQRYIIDIKTSSVDRAELDGYGGENEDQYGMVEDDKIQLNTYAYLMDQMDPNTNIVGLYILPITLTAGEKSYNREYNDADALKDFDPDNALLEVDFEKGNLHEVLGVEETDLIPKKEPRSKKGGKLDVSGVAPKKGAGETASALKQINEGGVSKETTKYDLAQVIADLNAAGFDITKREGKVQKTATTKKTPVIGPKTTTTQKVAQFNTGEALVNSGVDLLDVNFIEGEDELVVDGTTYYVNKLGKKASRFSIAKKVNGTWDFNTDISLDTLNKIGDALAAKEINSVAGSLVKKTFENTWKSRLESVSLQEKVEEESPTREVKKPKDDSTAEERVQIINDNSKNRPSDQIDFDSLSNERAKEVFKSLFSFAMRDANLKTKLGKIGVKAREATNYQDVLKDLVKLLENNSISREEMQKICK